MNRINNKMNRRLIEYNHQQTTSTTVNPIGWLVWMMTSAHFIGPIRCTSKCHSLICYSSILNRAYRIQRSNYLLCYLIISNCLITLYYLIIINKIILKIFIPNLLDRIDSVFCCIIHCLLFTLNMNIVYSSQSFISFLLSKCVYLNHLIDFRWLTNFIQLTIQFHHLLINSVVSLIVTFCSKWNQQIT